MEICGSYVFEFSVSKDMKKNDITTSYIWILSPALWNSLWNYEEHVCFSSSVIFLTLSRRNSVLPPEILLRLLAPIHFPPTHSLLLEWASNIAPRQPSWSEEAPNPRPAVFDTQFLLPNLMLEVGSSLAELASYLSRFALNCNLQEESQLPSGSCLQSAFLLSSGIFRPFAHRRKTERTQYLLKWEFSSELRVRKANY